MEKGERRPSCPFLHIIYTRPWRGKAKINQIFCRLTSRCSSCYRSQGGRERKWKFKIENNLRSLAAEIDRSVVNFLSPTIKAFTSNTGVFLIL